MSKRTIIVVGLAVVCGLSTAYGVSKLGGNSSNSGGKLETVEIVVTALDIARGKTITKDVVFLTKWPKSQLPEGAIKSIEDAVDRTVVIPLLKGEPLVEKKIAGSDEGRGLPSLIEKGMRAYTIHTPTAAAGVAGFILPGNRVDVLLMLGGASRGDTRGPVATTLLQNIEVLASNDFVVTPEGNKVKNLASVTLHVTPMQAKKLTLAQGRGVLNLALRNEGDTAATDSPPVTLSDIRIAQEKPVAIPDPSESKGRTNDRKPSAFGKWFERIFTSLAESKEEVKTEGSRTEFVIRTIYGTANGKVTLR